MEPAPCKCVSNCYHANLPDGYYCVRRFQGPVRDTLALARPTREQTFMDMAELMRKRSTCLRGQIGVVIVQDRRVIATGYNGTPPGALHCSDVGCQVNEDGVQAGCTRTVHAEANAIAWAARVGVATQGADLYTTHSPCPRCAQLILSAGIVRVFWKREYRLTEGMDLLKGLGVELIRIAE